MTSNQIAALRQQAVEALRRGDGQGARAALQPLMALPDAPFLPMAQACLIAGDAAAAETPVDRVLAVDPHNIGGLLLKAEVRNALGDSRAATAFFKTALDVAQRLPSIPDSMQPALARAREALSRLATQFEDDLRAHLERAGLTGSDLPPRVAEAVDIMTGRRQIYLQQPQSFYYPGLPQIQFYDTAIFPWVREFEARTPGILSEVQGVLARDTFRPYVESDPARPAKQNSMVGDERWGAGYLWKDGRPFNDNADRCPETMSALELAPIPRIAGRSPMALFSRLQAGMHIPPHTGFLNTRLICHLPLIVPEGCRLRVGNETREWVPGRMMIFDDSIEHEAWNRGSETRTVLLFEIWRPEIGEAEREALTAMFEYVAVY